MSQEERDGWEGRLWYLASSFIADFISVISICFIDLVFDLENMWEGVRGVRRRTTQGVGFVKWISPVRSDVGDVEETCS